MKLVTRHPAQLATCVHPTSAISRRTGKNPSRSLTTFAQHNNGAGPRSDDEVIIQDSDAAFLAKLLAVSFAGGAVIKYGSLAIDLPFQPNAAAALAIVLGPPAVYAVWLLVRPK